jgi:hypothetical protein
MGTVESRKAGEGGSVTEFTVETNINQVLRQVHRATRQYPEWVQEGINHTVQDIRADLERSVMTWNHPVDFDVSVTRQGKTITTTVGTDDEIFGYVDRGTKPHIITPKRPGYPLRFRSGYKAKTMPGRIWSRPGGAFGNMIRTMVVHHPGFPGRHILETATKKHEKSLLRYINLAITAGLQKAVSRVRWGGR